MLNVGCLTCPCEATTTSGMARDTLRVKVNVDRPCPCGSGRKTRRCCYNGKVLLRRVAPTAPPGALSGHAHPQCFARTTNNCSDDLSKEHFISAGILRQLNTNGGLAVAGAPWLLPGESRRVPPAALSARVLCKRHNEALSPLDQVAVDLFMFLERLFDVTRLRSKERLTKLISGTGLELWALKALCGFCASGNAVDKNGRVISGWTPPSDWIAVLEQRLVLPDGVGLHFHGPQGETFTTSANATLAPAHDLEGSPVGIILSIRGYEFVLAMGKPTTTEGTKLEGSHYHPGHIAWQHPHHREPRHHLLLSWSRSVGPSIVLTLG